MKHNSKMGRVLALMEAGVLDRYLLAVQLGFTTVQMSNTLFNLKARGYIRLLAHKSKGHKLGRDNSVYVPIKHNVEPSIWAFASSVFQRKP